jgi:hypothetical protein
MVLGQAVPLQGEFGISTNPESLTPDPDGFYWVDQMRGNVLQLKGDTIKSISDVGMRDWFNDNLQDLSSVLGTYDDKKKEYNVTLGKRVDKAQFRDTTQTLSWSQMSNGWTCFKGFGPEAGTSMNNEYYTWKEGSMWKHHAETDLSNNPVTRNNFYGTQHYSDVTLLFNDNPGSVKSYGTVNYEGTQARITPFTSTSVTNASADTWNITDLEYYDLWEKKGWYVESIISNLQTVDDLEFKDKEGKWFSTIQGNVTNLINLDEKEFSVQGLGYGSQVTTGEPTKGANYCFHICEEAESTCNSGMDVAFILDYTGSMSPAVEDCKTGISDIVDAIEVMADGEDYRLSLTVSDEQYTTSSANYINDSGYTALPSVQRDVNTSGTRHIYTTACEMFGTNNESSFTTQLNLLNTTSFRLGSGVGSPEPTDVALDMIGLNDFGGTWRSGVAKYVVVMTDALPGGFDDLYSSTDTTRMDTLASGFVTAGIKAIIIGPGVWQEDPNNAGVYPWQDFATATGGAWDDASTGDTTSDYSTATINTLQTLCESDSYVDGSSWCYDTPFPCITAAEGATVPSGYADVIIHNLCLLTSGVGAYSGYDLDAANFSISGATGTTTGSGNSTIYTWTGGSVTAGISRVEYTNVGIANDPGNTIQCRMYYSSFTMPVGGGNSCVYPGDVTVTPPPPGRVWRDACLRVSYYESNGGEGNPPNTYSTVTYTNIPVVVETSQPSWITAAGWNTTKHENTSPGVEEGLTTKVAEYLIEADANYHLASGGASAVYQSSPANSAWSSCYTFNYSHVTWPGSADIKSTSIEIFYTPLAGGDPAPGKGGFCAHLHEVRLDYLARPIYIGGNSGGPIKGQGANLTTPHFNSGGRQSLNTIANGAGNVNVQIWSGATKQYWTIGTLITAEDDPDKGYYRGSWGGTAVTNTISCVNGSNVRDIDVPTPTSTSKTFNVEYSVSGTTATDLLIGALPTVASPLTWTSQLNAISSITSTVPASSALDTPATHQGFSGIYGSTNNPPIKKNVSWIYSPTSPGVFEILRQPEMSDLHGGGNSFELSTTAALGSTVLIMATSDVTGITAGMTVSDNGFGYIPSGTTVTSVSSRNVTISNATTGVLGSGDLINFSNGWKYDINLVAVLSDPPEQITTDTKLTISGTISCHSIGAPGVSGDLTLNTANFISVT